MKGLLFTYLFTYGGAVISIFNPWYGLLIYICFAIVKPESMWYWSVPAGNYSRIVAIALLVGWALKGFGEWNFGKAKPIVLCLLGFWAWSVICLLFADNFEVGWSYVETKSKIFLPFLVGATLLRTQRQLTELAWTLVLSQGYVAYELNSSYYGGFNRLHELGFGGMDNNSAAIALAAASGLAFFLGLEEKRQWTRLLAFVAAALCVHCCFFAFSRGAMLSLCVLAVVSFILIPKRPMYMALFGLGIIVAFMLAGDQVVERFLTIFAEGEERDSSAQSRLDMWKICWAAMVSSPLFGLGPGHFRLSASSFGLTEGKSAHSLWFETGAEFGFPGVGLLIAFYVSCCWILYRELRKLSDTSTIYNRASRMVIASICGFIVAASFVTLPGLEFPYYVVLLGVGALQVSQFDLTHLTSSNSIHIRQSGRASASTFRHQTESPSH